MIRELFLPFSPDATIETGDNSFDGAKIYFENSTEAKAVSFKATLGAITYSVYLRYYNGKKWLEWKLLEQNDSSGTSVFGASTDYPSTTVIDFNLLLQRGILKNMSGIQARITRISGAGAITLEDGYANIS